MYTLSQNNRTNYTEDQLDTVTDVPAEEELNICLPTFYSDIIYYDARYSVNIITSVMVAS